MKTKIALFIVGLLSCNCYADAQSAQINWQQAVGIFTVDDPTPSIQYNVNAYATALDNAGNIYTTGELTGKAKFSGVTIDGSTGNIYLAKYNSSNDLVWVNTYGNGVVRNICVGTDGNIYMYGFFNNKMSIGNVVLNARYGYRDVFVAKINGDGDVIWAKNGGGKTDMFVYVHGMTLTPNNEVIITGSSLSPVKFEFENVVLTEGQNFVAKYNSDGNIVWAKAPFSAANATTLDIAVDKDANVYITGGFTDTLKFEEGTIVGNISSLTSAYLAKFDAVGNFKWVRTAGLKGSVQGFGLACDAQKNIYEFGNADSTVMFGSITSNPDNNAKFYLAKYDSTGSIQWINRFGGPGSLNSYEFTPQDICVDKNNNINVMGTFVHSVQFTTEKKLTTSYNSIFVAQYNTTGSLMWANSGGGTIGNNAAGGIAVDNNNAIYVSGSYKGDTAIFGHSKLINTVVSNAYLAKIADVTGIKSQTNTLSAIKVYPNPVTDELTVTGLQNGTQMQVFDIVGRICVNAVSTKETERINTSSLIKGNYLLRLTSKNDISQQSFKITKQ